MAASTGNNNALVIGVSAALVYDVISATNSSPQTTEINAKARAQTLMKWVNIGIIQAAGLILLMACAEPSGKKWRPILGGGVGGLLIYGQYVYALKCGLASQEPGTEDYGSASVTPGTTPSVSSGSTGRVRGA